MMITLLGTGHVFKIAEPVSFIVKNIWPDAVLIELDEKRYGRISAPAHHGNERKNEIRDDVPRAYRKMAEYQRDMAEEYDSRVGAEFVAAAETGRMIGAIIEFIDKDADLTMAEMWEEMPLFEKLRFNLSAVRDRFRSKNRATEAIADFNENEEAYMSQMRKRFPTMVRKLIDERNEHMAAKIKNAASVHKNIIAVVGDAHVEGLASLLGTEGIRKIRLKTLMDGESMNALRSELWSGKKKEGEDDS